MWILLMEACLSLSFLRCKTDEDITYYIRFLRELEK